MNRPNRDNVVESQRNFPRVSRACPVKYSTLTDVPDMAAQNGGDAAVMNNISGGGISFTTPDAMAVGTMLALEVDLPGFPTSVISMGRVVWCRPSEEERGRHEVGVEFWWVGWRDAEAQMKVSSFITKALKD